MTRGSEFFFNTRLTLPDLVKVERFRRAPDLGPRLLFFSGGSALFQTSRVLTHFTHNSIHLITPFDSGGSSREIRNQFKMLAVGDLRSRLMALADQSFLGNPDVYRLFATRLPLDLEPSALATELKQLVDGEHPLIRALQDPLRKIIRNHLRFFQNAMPATFNLAGASIGNLILVGGYHNNRRQMDPTLYLFGKLVEARGMVRPITTSNLDLKATYQDGIEVVGQHLITGKESKAKPNRIERLKLVGRSGGSVPKLKRKVAQLIETADLICYPMGSFYSSLLCQFSVKGTAEAIAKNPVPKVYIPNWGDDPEEYGLTLADKVERLLDSLKCNAERPLADSDVLNFVLIDRQGGPPEFKSQLKGIEARGIQVIDCDLADPNQSGLIDPNKLVLMLLSF